MKFTTEIITEIINDKLPEMLSAMGAAWADNLRVTSADWLLRTKAGQLMIAKQMEYGAPSARRHTGAQYPSSAGHTPAEEYPRHGPIQVEAT